MTIDSNATVAHLTGVVPFDVELGSFLSSHGSLIRRNLLSGMLEVHDVNGVQRLTDTWATKMRFRFVYARNGREPAKDKFLDALEVIGDGHAYHPIRDYLAGLRWDGVKRLDGWLTRYATADNSRLNWAFSRKTLCAAVSRVMRPGTKFDQILILQGPQGLGKSSLIRSLVPDPEWFTDQIEVGASAQKTIEQTSGKWIVEIPELDGLGRKDANRIKSFITTTSDEARLTWNKYRTDRQRQFILFGTTNDETFLSDLTGNRRWWIARVGTIDVTGLLEVRDQLWAEAVAAEPDELLYLDSADLKADAADIAGQAIDHGAWFELLADTIPEGDMRLSCKDAWALVGIGDKEIHKASRTHGHNMRAALAGLGFERTTRNMRRHGKQVACYVRGSLDAPWWKPGNPLPRDNEDSGVW